MNPSRVKIAWKFDRKTAPRKFGYKRKSLKLENRERTVRGLGTGGCFVIASQGKSVTQIAQTTTCIVMRAQASGLCEIANNTLGTNDKIRTTAVTRRHVRIGF